VQLSPGYLETNLTPEQRAADPGSPYDSCGEDDTDAEQLRGRSTAQHSRYQWWSEALHGVINDGVTEYPEPIGLAATV
jgi:beta-glucosidase